MYTCMRTTSLLLLETFVYVECKSLFKKKYLAAESVNVDNKIICIESNPSGGKVRVCILGQDSETV